MAWISGNEGAMPRARLSQRGGFAMDSIETGDVKSAFVAAVGQASSFEALAPWAQAIILDAEATYAAIGDPDATLAPRTA